MGYSGFDRSMERRSVLIRRIKNETYASISLDLDNQWSYMKTHGDAGWEKLPSYLDTFIPHVLDLLEEVKTKITFFIVGQDAALQRNRAALREITRKGHEVGNHSFNHEVWMHRDTTDQIRREILQAHRKIIEATGQQPIGFRGPGFTWSPRLLKVLADIGYVYDASSLPTYLGPVARMYFFGTANLNNDQKNKRAHIYGDLKDGLRPIKPYYWHLGPHKKMLEIPVTTIPFIKSPFHLSYLIYLSRFSDLLMRLYLMTAIGLCKLTSTQPSFLLHPLDMISGDSIKELSFFPGMDLSTHRKVRIFKKVIRLLSKHFKLVTMEKHARHLFESRNHTVKRLEYEAI